MQNYVSGTPTFRFAIETFSDELSALDRLLRDAVLAEEGVIRDIMGRLKGINRQLHDTISSANLTLLQVTDAFDTLLDLLDGHAGRPLPAEKLHCLISPLKWQLDTVSREVTALV
ncbi:hypothetical protein PTE30175_04469 [Pandoraea terrae]|uniref:Uncharacterized protein n=1 Tax=Pandoraea terrae TaxID=1537710 RepID=A0A5E4YJP1_9BURK|nr:DUF1484 family protein [Pandoraea terrae]VVE48949.1 hypothetical protein PTE30175_04469 [Pandoraea terrae]